jgi:ureidoglycolate lyase
VTRNVEIEPLSAKAFARFGQVIEVGDTPVMINQGNCARHNDLVALDFIGDGIAGVSVFNAKPYSLPLSLTLMERHPLGSQCFMPMTDQPFLVVVADDDDGIPGAPRAFMTNGQQGVNYGRNIWHAVLTPLNQAARFTVIDRIGSGDNLQEHTFAQPFVIVSTT